MMKLFFNFGESIENYDYLVINEREARASAGIMFLLGLLSLFSVYILRTMLWAELFSITFIIEFFTRIIFSPKYAPYMLLGGLIVHNQKPEWVEAKPKKFVWSLGLLLGAVMTYYIVFDLISLARLSICLVCLTLLYLESAFGICLGCLLYHKLNITLTNCPGGVCDTSFKPSYGKNRAIILLFFILLFIAGFYALQSYKYTSMSEIIIVEAS